jgi:probable phosphoglycerate mutase
MKTRILLVRHGGTLFSAVDRFAGSSNVNLSDEGRDQAAKLGKRLAPTRIDAAYCSPMQRAIDTAKLALGSRTLIAVERDGLREVDHGHWEGKVHDEVEKKFPDEYAAWTADPFTMAPPGGETGLQVLARALPALRQIVIDHPKQTVLVVCHKATNRILLCSLLGMDMRTYRHGIDQDLACLNVLEFDGAWSGSVRLMNDISHYQPAPT